MNTPNQRPMNSLDFISVISALAVTFLHANNCFWTFSRERYWITANIIESVCFFAVPLFFMMSGITLLDYRKKYSTKAFIRKRIKKVVIPYLFWSILGIMWTYGLFSSRYGSPGITFIQIINKLLNGSGISFYWFFIPLFMIYFSIPFISEIKSKQRIKLFSGYIIIFLIINGTLPLLNNIFKIGLNLEKWRIPVLGGYLVYPLAGYVIYNVTFTKGQKYLLYSLGICGLLVMILGTYYSSLSINAVNNLFKGDLNIPCMFYAFAMFMFLKEIFPLISKSKLLFKLIWILRHYTFSIYLLQFFVLESISLFILVDHRSIFYRLLCPFFVSVVIIFVTKILRLSKLGRIVLPE